MKFKKILMIFSLVVFSATAVHAQNNGRPSAFEGQDEKSNKQQPLTDTFGAEPPIDVVEMKITTDDYIEPSFTNLSKLMWALSVMDLSDNVAIDNYLKINECELYLRFFHNDIEWDKIRNATREYINRNVQSFPVKFEIIVPIYLDRYNSERQYFALTEDSKMTNLRRLDVSMNARTRVCDDAVELKGYSRNLILNFNRPFTLTRIPVKRQLAELYIEEARTHFENLPPKARMIEYERVAYLRAKVRISSFKEFHEGVRGDIKAAVFAQLDGIEIYADLERQKLLYREDRKQRSARQRRLEMRQEEVAAENFGVVEEEAPKEAAPVEEKKRLPKTPYGIVPGETPAQ